jgi:nicotinamide phosphoribosyltransferase
MSFATKLSYIKAQNGDERLVMKKPKTDGGKHSLPGVLQVQRIDGKLTVLPRDSNLTDTECKNNELVVCYDNGPVAGFKWDDFDTVKARIAEQWPKADKTHDAVSDVMKEKVKQWIVDHNKSYAEMIKSMDL